MRDKELHKTRVVFEESLLPDGGAGLSGNAVPGFFQKGDESCPTLLGFRKLYGGLNLGEHTAGGELSLLFVLPGFIGGHGVQPFLVRLSKIDGHLLNGGEDDEAVGVQLLRQKLRSEVLVDDRARAPQVIALAYDGECRRRRRPPRSVPHPPWRGWFQFQ